MTSNERQRAAERGEIKYISPRPCRHGHVVRYTANGDCAECQQRWVKKRRQVLAQQKRARGKER